jgi:Skp family chaperone for outer membrane proteins
MGIESSSNAIVVSVEIVVLIIAMFVALVGLVYRNLSIKVDRNEAALGSEVDRLSQNYNRNISEMHMDLNQKINKLDASLCYIKDGTMSKDQCRATQQLNEERSINVHKRIDDVRELNREEHQELFNLIRAMNETLTSVRECVVGLASGTPPKVQR